MEDWLRGCVYHDGRHGEVTLPTDKVLEIAEYIQLTRTNGTDGLLDIAEQTEQSDCPYKEYPCAVCDEQTDCPWK